MTLRSLLVLLLLLAACPLPSPEAGGEEDDACSSSSDCADGFDGELGECVSTCGSDADCSDGEVCGDDDTGTLHCLPPSSEGEVCFSENNGEEYGIDVPCADGLRCVVLDEELNEAVCVAS